MVEEAPGFWGEADVEARVARQALCKVGTRLNWLAGRGGDDTSVVEKQRILAAQTERFPRVRQGFVPFTGAVERPRERIRGEDAGRRW